MSERFVILHHTLPDGEHWDLMLERGAGLMTWQLFRDPMTPGPWPIEAGRIGEHRKAYLEYEGPVSGNRGNVTRVESGTYELQAAGADRWTVELRGERLVGAFVLEFNAGRWVFREERADESTG